MVAEKGCVWELEVQVFDTDVLKSFPRNDLGRDLGIGIVQERISQGNVTAVHGFDPGDLPDQRSFGKGPMVRARRFVRGSIQRLDDSRLRPGAVDPLQLDNVSSIDAGILVKNDPPGAASSRGHPCQALDDRVELFQVRRRSHAGFLNPDESATPRVFRKILVDVHLRFFLALVQFHDVLAQLVQGLALVHLVQGPGKIQQRAAFARASPLQNEIRPFDLQHP